MTIAYFFQNSEWPLLAEIGHSEFKYFHTSQQACDYLKAILFAGKETSLKII